MKFPAPPFRVQSTEFREAEVREAEVEDDYGTNPTHEPTETRRSSYGNPRRPYRG